MTAAAALFLDAVLQLEAEGWLRGFLDALVAAGQFPLASVVSCAASVRVGMVQPGEERVLRRPYCSLLLRKGACKRNGDRLFFRVHSDRTGVMMLK